MVILALTALSVAISSSCSRQTPETVSANPPATSAPAAASAAAAAPTANGFGPTFANTAPPPRPAPAGMVWVPGGEFSMGAADSPSDGEVGMQATKDSRPVHRVYVDGFYMDKTDVTNAEFARFVKATGHVTVAERKPR